MGTIVITGAASGIGAATRARLEADGHTVVGVDLRDTEVTADLATAEGRAAMVDDVTAATGGRIDGLVAAAGIAAGPGELVASVNYYGAVASIADLRPALAAAGGSVVALSSNSTSTAPQVPGLAATLLDADEAAGREAASVDESGLAVYPATKTALAHWVRRNAVTADWIGAGINLNAVAPGFIDTPMTAGGWDFVQTLGDEVFPVPAGRPGRPEEIAATIAFLLGPDARFFVGSVLFCDGGTDAALRTTDWPSPRG